MLQFYVLLIYVIGFGYAIGFGIAQCLYWGSENRSEIAFWFVFSLMWPLFLLGYVYNILKYWYTRVRSTPP